MTDQAESSPILLATARTPKFSDVELAAKVRALLPGLGDDDAWFGLGDLNIRVGLADLKSTIESLQESQELRFELLSSITAVHWPKRDREFELVYHLRSVSSNLFMAVKTDIAMGEKPPTLSGMFLTADWQERECYDMFGIEFEGHPDLRRILMPDPYPWFPLRKEFPLEGPDFPIDGYQTDALGKVDADEFWKSQR